MNDRVDNKMRPSMGSMVWCLIISAILSTNGRLSLAQLPPLPEHAVWSEENMVASVNPLATAAGVRALESGGNAVDAAVATALALGVVDGFNSGIGGGCFVLIRTPAGAVIAIDGREMAPAAAHRDLYKVDGEIQSELATTGALASGVPGAVMAYFQAVENHGRLPMKSLLNDTAKIAEDGFAVTEKYASVLKSVQKKLSRFPESARILLRPDGEAHPVGQRLRLPDLARTYRSLAQHGTDWFYKGEFSERTERWMSANGGILTQRDFANYRTVLRQPIRSTYRGYEIVGFPPPSSGGVHVAQILNILESFDLRELASRDRSRFLHVIAEAMKLAFADRAYWLGDSDYVHVPTGLLSKAYAQKMAQQIDIDSVTQVESHGTPPDANAKFFERHTTHIAAADADGYWVAITTTVNTQFGSGVVIPDTGVVMNNQMDDFAIAPGVRNSFGLVGAEQNSIASGKRPLSSMSPTIVLKDGKPVFTAGAAGGPKIITEVVLAIINHIDFGMNAAEALESPRIHHQWSPDKLRVERSLSEADQKALEALGHQLFPSNVMGYCQAISFDERLGKFVGAHDPRIDGKAAGTDSHNFRTHHPRN